MKVQVLSDLHLEFGYSSSLKFNQADLIILAGDTHIGTKGIEWVKTIPKCPRYCNSCI